jgi:formylmethanofuran:tetrahydromethanopterin formyltransferase
MPDFPPEVDSDIGHSNWVAGGFRGIVRAKTSEAVAGGGKEELKAGDNIEFSLPHLDGGVVSNGNRVGTGAGFRGGDRDEVISESVFKGVKETIIGVD